VIARRRKPAAFASKPREHVRRIDYAVFLSCCERERYPFLSRCSRRKTVDGPAARPHRSNARDYQHLCFSLHVTRFEFTDEILEENAYG